VTKTCEIRGTSLFPLAALHKATTEE